MALEAVGSIPITRPTISKRSHACLPLRVLTITLQMFWYTANMMLDRYVTFRGDSTLTAPVREAFEWFASTEEGLHALEDCLALHKAPIQVIAAENIIYNGYGDDKGNHVMFINPNLVKSAAIVTDDGRSEIQGMKRLVAHECEHARQPDVLEKAKAYAVERGRIWSEAEKEINEAIESEFHKIKGTISNEESLITAAKEVFEIAIKPRIAAFRERFSADIRQSEIVRDFVNSFEVPAIKFENQMAARYNLGAQRTLDYLALAQANDVSAQFEKDGFVTSVVGGYRQSKQDRDDHFWRNQVKDGGRRTSKSFAIGGLI